MTYRTRSPHFRRLPRDVQDQLIDREIRVQEAIQESLRNMWRGARRPRYSKRTARTG